MPLYHLPTQKKHPLLLFQAWPSTPPPSVCSIPCCAVSRCRNEIPKKERWRFLFSPKKKKSFSYILSTVSDTLQPSQGVLIQIQFSSCYHPPVPSSFTSFLHPSFFSFSPPSFFLLSHVSPLAAIFCYRPALYLSVATWKATCALVARGKGGQS